MNQIDVDDYIKALLANERPADLRLNATEKAWVAAGENPWCAV